LPPIPTAIQHLQARRVQPITVYCNILVHSPKIIIVFYGAMIAHNSYTAEQKR
jgi:hypothetical protein